MSELVPYVEEPKPKLGRRAFLLGGGAVLAAGAALYFNHLERLDAEESFEAQDSLSKAFQNSLGALPLPLPQLNQGSFTLKVSLHSLRDGSVLKNADGSASTISYDGVVSDGVATVGDLLVLGDSVTGTNPHFHSSQFFSVIPKFSPISKKFLSEVVYPSYEVTGTAVKETTVYSGKSDLSLWSVVRPEDVA